METKKFFRESLRLQKLQLKERVAILSPIIEDFYFSSDSMNGLTYQPNDTRSGYLHLEDGKVQAVICFATNDYLGLAIDEQVVRAATEATLALGVSFCGSVALNGTNPSLNALEQTLADFKGAESCVVFPSGFSANYGWITSLCRKTDLVFIDEYIHTSVNEGLARQVEDKNIIKFRHLDFDDLAQKLAGTCSKERQDKYVVIEGVYSMHGTMPDIDAFAQITENHGGVLIVDDAHGTGTVGMDGRGYHQSSGLKSSSGLIVGTLSKAIGCVGGFVAGSHELINLVRTRSTPLLFSAAPPPSILAAASKSLEIIQNQPERVKLLKTNVSYARSLLARFGVDRDSESPIISVVLPREVDLRSEVQRIRCSGVFLNGVEFPAIPLGEKRLRVSINAAHTLADIDAMANQIAIAFQPLALKRSR